MINFRKDGFEAVIRCSCQRCGMWMEGFTFDCWHGDDEGREHASPLVTIWWWKDSGMVGLWAGFRRRLRMAWDVIRGEKWWVGDMIVGRDEIIELRDACDRALSEWPAGPLVTKSLEQWYAEMTPAEKEAQRRSFAYGNAALHNPNVTREMIDEEAAKLAAEKKDEGEKP